MLALDVRQQLRLPVEDFVGRSTALLGITGSGKTNTAAVIIEELLSSGLPMTIVDIEGEYYGIKQLYNVLVVGRSEHAELDVTPENAGALAYASVERGVSVILDLSDYAQDEMHQFLQVYFQALWEAASKAKRPYEIVLEEAHEFVPQGIRTPLKQLLTRIALRGRKRGLGIIMMSQRSAKVEKDVLTQASLLFLHRVVHPTDMRIYQDLIPLPAKEVEQTVGALQPGQAVIVRNHVPQVAQIRLRNTFHAGSTPMLGTMAQPELRRIDESLLRDLQRMIATTTTPSSSESALQKAEKRIKELEGTIAVQQAEIERLQAENTLLSKLTVSMDGKPMETAVHLPETMNIDQATIERASIQEIHAPPMTGVVVEAQPIPSVAAVGPVVQKAIAPPLNEAKFASLKRRFDAVPAPQRRLLQVLTEQEKVLSLDELAAWLGVSESTIRKSGYTPTAFLRMGLIERRPGARTYYRSCVRAYLQREFPGVDQEVLLQRLFR